MDSKEANRAAATATATLEESCDRWNGWSAAARCVTFGLGGGNICFTSFCGFRFSTSQLSLLIVAFAPVLERFCSSKHFGKTEKVGDTANNRLRFSTGMKQSSTFERSTARSCMEA